MALLDKTLTYTENVPEDIGYSTELSGATGTVKIEISPSSTSTYPGRLTTGIFNNTASVWIVNDQKWVCEGTQAEVNAALDDLTFEPEASTYSTITYNITVTDAGSPSTPLGNGSTITLTGGKLVPGPTLSSSSTAPVSYTASSRTKLDLPDVAHVNNQILKVQLRLRMDGNDPNYQSHDTFISSGAATVTHSTGPIASQLKTPYGYFDIRVYSGNVRIQNSADTGLCTFNITSGGTGYTSPPTVTLTAGSHDSDGTGTAVVDSDASSPTYRQVTGITSTDVFTTAPSVSISGGGGSSATATASITKYTWEMIGTIAEINKAFENVYYVSPADTSYNPTVYVDLTVTDGTNTI